MASKQACYLYTDEKLQFGNKLEYERAQLEVKRCKDDIIYFAENFCYIIDNQGKNLIKLRDFQKNFLTNQHMYANYMLMCSRQVGKSTIAAIAITHFAIFNPYKFIALVSKDKSGAKEVLEKIRVIYSSLPKYMQRAVVTFGKEHAELANEVRIRPFPAQSDEIRGFSIDYLYLDEFAFLHQNIADSFMASVMPTLASKPNYKLLITTTPKGKNHFYRMWNQAKDELTEEDIENGVFKRAKIIWSDIPGRDEKWANKTKATLGGDELLFKQEYECEFLDQFTASIYNMKVGYNYWDSDTVTKVKVKEIDPIAFASTADVLMDLAIFYKNTNLLNDPDNVFIAGVDVALGLDEDYSVINVFWLNKEERRYEQFFKYSNNTIQPKDFAYTLDCILNVMLKGRVQWLAIENNPGGGGCEVISRLVDISPEYASLIYSDEWSTKKGVRGNMTNEVTKAKRVVEIKSLLQSGKMILHDPETILEHCTLIKDGRKIRGAGTNGTHGHDDECSSVWQIADSVWTEEYGQYFSNRAFKKKEPVKIEVKQYVNPFAAKYREYDSYILNQNVVMDENGMPVQDINYYKALFAANSGKVSRRKIGLYG